MIDVHPAWLPQPALRAVGSARVLVYGDGSIMQTVLQELQSACQRYGGTVRHVPTGAAEPADGEVFDLILALSQAAALPAAAVAARDGLADEQPLGESGYALAGEAGVTVVLAEAPAGLLYGLFHLVRLGEAAFDADRTGASGTGRRLRRRMLDHWDNVDVHPVMGQVERGYAGGSIFWRDGAPRGDLTRVRAYARLLAACGVNAISVNNVNVHATEARLLTDRLGDVAAIADVLRPYGIRVHLSVSFAAPIVLGGLPTADPLDEQVRPWWAETTRRVYERDPGLRRVRGEGRLGGAAGPVRATAATTPTARTCSPTRWPRTAAWCTGGRSSTTTARTGATARPTGRGPRTTTSPRSTGSSATT